MTFTTFISVAGGKGTKAPAQLIGGRDLKLATLHYYLVRVG